MVTACLRNNGALEGKAANQGERPACVGIAAVDAVAAAVAVTLLLKHCLWSGCSVVYARSRAADSGTYG
jgi:hypothetical protein